MCCVITLTWTIHTDTVTITAQNLLQDMFDKCKKEMGSTANSENKMPTPATTNPIKPQLNSVFQLNKDEEPEVQPDNIVANLEGTHQMDATDNAKKFYHGA